MTNPEKREKLKTETSEIVNEIFAKVGMDVPTTLIDSILSMTHSIAEDESLIDDDLDGGRCVEYLGKSICHHL